MKNICHWPSAVSSFNMQRECNLKQDTHGNEASNFAFSYLATRSVLWRSTRQVTVAKLQPICVQTVGSDRKSRRDNKMKHTADNKRLFLHVEAFMSVFVMLCCISHLRLYFDSLREIKYPQNFFICRQSAFQSQ